MVRYQTLVEFTSHGQTYRAQSLTGKQAQTILTRGTAIDGLDEESHEVEQAGLDMAAYVTSVCLLNGEDRPAFGEGKEDAVLEDVPWHIISACFTACMEDAGLKEPEPGEEGASGN